MAKLIILITFIVGLVLLLFAFYTSVVTEEHYTGIEAMYSSSTLILCFSVLACAVIAIGEIISAKRHKE